MGSGIDFDRFIYERPTFNVQNTLPANTYHQLIVLGNGFDKACGLHSSFWEFFEPRMEIIKSLEEKYPGDGMTCAQALRDAGITAWDVVLYLRKEFTAKGAEIKWCDVESVIADVMNMDPEGEDDLEIDGDKRVDLGELSSYFYYSKKHSGIRDVNAYADQISNAAAACITELENGENLPEDGGEEEWQQAQAAYDEANFLLPNPYAEYVAQFLLDMHPSLIGADEQAISNALMEERHLLEAEFNRYLSADVAASRVYEELSGDLLVKMFAHDSRLLSGSEDDEQALSILSFNYTNPNVPVRIGKKMDVELINIHGKLGEEVIFGADGSKCLSDTNAAKFSKTYRVLELERPDRFNSIAFSPATGGIGWTETVAIKFFGHSLARADYSYFQSIFDIVDLYGGDVRLYFFYTHHGDNDRQELLSQVGKLLEEYGRTLDNEAHGRNLMHKLMLENRLIIKELPAKSLNQGQLNQEKEHE